MRATLIHGDHDIRLEEVPDPVLSTGGDAIVKVVASCVCGSDLWGIRGAEVTTIKVGDFVIAPFYDCDMTCANCFNGVSTSCLHGGWWGSDDRMGAFADGGQGEYVRVPHADGTLVATPGHPSDELIPGLLTLADVMGTGHHVAASAGVTKGSTVAVVGDGAVGLCAVLAAKRLGASRIVAMSRHADRQAVALEFGATDIVEERGAEGIARIRKMFDGIGPDCVLECVGTTESMDQALRSVRLMFNSCCPMCSPGRSPPVGCSTWSCRSPRLPRPMPRWTSAVRSRCCCAPS